MTVDALQLAMTGGITTRTSFRTGVLYASPFAGRGGMPPRQFSRDCSGAVCDRAEIRQTELTNPLKPDIVNFFKFKQRMAAWCEQVFTRALLGGGG